MKQTSLDKEVVLLRETQGPDDPNGLDKYSQVYDSVDWDSGQIGKFWHSNCKR